MTIVKCLCCGRILKADGTFKQCDCPNQTFVDDGYMCVRCGGMDLSKVKVIRNSEEYKEN